MAPRRALDSEALCFLAFPSQLPIGIVYFCFYFGKSADEQQRGRERAASVRVDERSSAQTPNFEPAKPARAKRN
jgi:hypothetical protein